jgi:hypothetical protein
MVPSSYRAAPWLGSAIRLWALLAVLARVPTREAAAVTSALFVAALPVTYVAVLGAAVRASVRRRLAVMRAVAVTLALFAGAGLLELAAAARLVHWELVFAALRGERPEYVADPDLIFRHAPDVRRSARMRTDIEMAWGLPASRSETITVTYDARGYRNPATPTRAEIVLIGDSYVAGHAVSDDEVVSRILEARLGRPVANLGVAGYGTAQELAVFERDALPLAPWAVVWFFFEGNDLYNDHQFENALLAPREERATAWTARHGWWRRSFVRSAHGQARERLAWLVPTFCPDFGIMREGPHRGQRILFWPEAAVPWTAFEQQRWHRATETLRRAAVVTREHGATLLLVYVPIKFRVYRDAVDVPSGGAPSRWTLWPLPDLFAQFCRAEALACLDLTNALGASVRAGGMPHVPADSHWSAEGHRLVAERIMERLR